MNPYSNTLDADTDDLSGDARDGLAILGNRPVTSDAADIARFNDTLTREAALAAHRAQRRALRSSI